MTLQTEADNDAALRLYVESGYEVVDGYCSLLLPLADEPRSRSDGAYHPGMLKGRCACKAVGFEVADEFVVAYNCHCSNCRALTGAAFLPMGQIEREKLKVTAGAESLLVEGDRDAEHEVRCGKCFSLLYWAYPDGSLGVPYGALSDEPTLKPMHHQFVGSKAAWYEILDDLPRYDEYPWSPRGV